MHSTIPRRLIVLVVLLVLVLEQKGGDCGFSSREAR
jgi:hypothetical protein